MRKAFLAASALTLALSGAAWAQSTPPAATTGMHKPAPSGLVEQNSRSAMPGVDNAAGATTPGGATTGGPVVDRATAGASASAGSSTPPAAATGSAVPVRNATSGLPPIATSLPQDQYVLQMGERMRQWFPIVDTYLDAGIPPEHANLQTNVKTAWARVRAEWDQLQRADANSWNGARSDFEAAYTNFERVWDDAQRKS